MKETVLLDVDGVLVDLASVVHSSSQEILQRELPPPGEWAAYDFAQAMHLTSSQAARVFTTFRQRDNLARLANFYPGAVSFVHNLLSCGYDVCFVTKPWDDITSWRKDRWRMLKDHWPEQDVLFLGEKHRVIGHHLVDDCLDQIHRNHRRGILFDRPWNRHGATRGVRRCRDYRHVIQRIAYGEIDEDTEVDTLGCSASSSVPPTDEST